MNIITQVSINIFPLVMLLIILSNNKKKNTKSLDRRHFNVLTILVIGLMIFDILRYVLSGSEGQGGRTALWLAHFLYLMCIVSVSSTWLMYVASRLNVGGNHENRAKLTKFLSVISLLYAVVAVSTWWTGALFEITPEGVYVKGKYYYITYMVSIALIVGNMIMILYVRSKEGSKERRKECILLLLCGFPPLVGIAMQHLWRDWWVGATAVSLTLLFLYLNNQNRQITTDALTGLNNRMEFDQYIFRRAEQSGNTGWGLFMLDVDDFKLINDTLGHAVGDEALWETADILRRILGKDKIFIARYGGDEFAVVGDWETEQEARAAIARVEDELARYNRELAKNYKLSFSIGYAMWHEVDTIEQLIEKADERMYAIKTRKKSKAQNATDGGDAGGSN